MIYKAIEFGIILVKEQACIDKIFNNAINFDNRKAFSEYFDEENRRLMEELEPYKELRKKVGEAIRNDKIIDSY